MQIDRIELYHLAIPLRQPLPAPGSQWKAMETVIAKMQSGSAVGWGEASPGNGPLAGAEWAAGAFSCARDWLAPCLVGASVDSGNDLQERLQTIRGNNFAKSALDVAWWDLYARQQGKPLPELLGKSRDAVEVGTMLDRMESIDDFLVALRAALAAGYSRIELKFRPGWDVQMVNFVRHEFPTERFHIDVEGTMTLGQTELLCRLDDFSLAMIEQPFPAHDLVAHAMIQESIRTPICLDESITSPEIAEIALELHSAKFLNLKLGRVGGITPAATIHDLAHEHCAACWVGATPQTAIGARASLALASKPNCTYPADLFRSDEALEADLAPLPELSRDESDGVLRMKLWSEPGLGVEPNAELLEKYAVAKATIG